MRIIYVFTILIASAEEQYREPSEEEYLTMDLSSTMDEHLPYASQLLLDNQLDPMPIPDFRGSVYVIVQGRHEPTFTPVEGNTEDISGAEQEEGCDFGMARSPSETFRVSTKASPLLPTIDHKATLVLSSGSLKYVSEFQRNGSAFVTYRDSMYSANAVVEFDNVLLTYDYSLKLMLLRHHGYIDAEAYSIRANVTVDVNATNYRVALRRLDLSNTESIHVWIRGSNWMQWMITPVTNIFVGLFKNPLIKVVEEIATAMIRKYIHDFVAEMFL